MKNFKVGDVVFVSNPDKEYEKEYGVRVHRNFFGKVIEVMESKPFDDLLPHARDFSRELGSFLFAKSCKQNIRMV